MKKIKFKITAICIGVLLSLFFGEITARVYFFGSSAFSYSKTNSFGILDNSGLIKYSNSDDLLYELLPNLDTKYKLLDFHTNNEGFRDINHKLDTSDIAIAFLGDSFTMGTGVKTSEMYVTQTGKKLNQSNNKLKFKALNFGVSGYALTDYKTVLVKKALKHKPDLVVIGFCASNDHYRVGIDFSLEDFKIKPKKNVFWDSYLKKLLQIKLNTKPPEKISYKEEHIAYMNKQFGEFRKIFNANNSKGLIFYLDLIHDPIRIEQIKELAKKNNLLFLDVSEFFKNKNLSKYILNELDPHPNGKANQIFADKLSNFILSHQKEIFYK